jgi:hypothetical protein
MNRTLDWRPIVLIGFVLLFLFSAYNRNPVVSVVVLAVSAGWFIQTGIAPWRSGRNSLFGSQQVKYWRGERVVLRQPPARSRLRSVSGMQLGVSLLYLALGLASAYAAIMTFVQMVALRS